MVTGSFFGSPPVPVNCTTPRMAPADAGIANPRQATAQVASASHFTADMRTPCRLGVPAVGRRPSLYRMLRSPGGSEAEGPNRRDRSGTTRKPAADAAGFMHGG